MKRSTRFATVIFLAGLVQVSLAGDALAENSPWRFSAKTDPLTDVVEASVSSKHVNGARIIFGCESGNALSEFGVVASTKKIDKLAKGHAEIAWRTDEGPVHNESWVASTTVVYGGTGEFGKTAYDFALAVMRAQQRIVFKNANGTVVFDANGSTKAIRQLLKACNLET